MATEKLVAGAVSSFTSLMTTELNSLTNGQAIMGSSAVSNNTNLDLFAEFSFVGGGSITPTGSPFLGLYLYPQNGDGTTYGDGHFVSAQAGPPPSNYYKGYCGISNATAGTQVGTFSIPGTSFNQVLLPRGAFVPVLYNATGVTLTSSGNVLYYRTTNLSIA